MGFTRNELVITNGGLRLTVKDQGWNVHSKKRSCKASKVWVRIRVITSSRENSIRRAELVSADVWKYAMHQIIVWITFNHEAQNHSAADLTPRPSPPTRPLGYHGQGFTRCKAGLQDYVISPRTAAEISSYTIETSGRRQGQDLQQLAFMNRQSTKSVISP